MREIRTSGSMRGGRKRAFARRACLLLYAWKGAAALVPASAHRNPERRERSESGLTGLRH
jgi:hypothetical protein